MAEAGQAEPTVGFEDAPQIVQDGPCIVFIEQVEHERGQHTVRKPVIGG